MGLNCPLCQKDYTTTGKLQPRLLIGCGHTFCQNCLDDRQLPDGRMECPQCSLISTEPHAPNITIMNYVDVQTERPSQVTHPVPAPQKTMCQDCKKRVATLICFQCLPGGFNFCDTCSDLEHSRAFAPVKGHAPRPIANVRFETPVPICQVHPGQPCLYFSFKVNQFACEECKSICNFEQDRYMPIDTAVAQVRDELPSLIQLTRERVDTIAHTRAQLDELLRRVDQEGGKALDRVRVEFQQFEIALKKRLGSVEQTIEKEVHFQKKALTVQMDELEVAQGRSDTSVVQANMILQMSDYNYLQQAESIIGNIRGQLSEEDVPLYQGPVTEGLIPVHIPPAFLEDIDKLGTVGGGAIPDRLTCEVDSESGFLMLKWEQPDPLVREYEIQCEPMEEKDADPLMRVSAPYAEYRQKIQTPVKIKVDTAPSSSAQWRLDGLMVGKKYSIRMRSLNTAGRGIWSNQMIAQFPEFPVNIGYSGSIVNLVIPCDGMYCITARGAKAADGETRKGGRGAIVEAKFLLSKYDTLIILSGGMSQKVGTSSGGGGGTFVAHNKEIQLLLAAGGGGGTRGYDLDDHDGRDANIETSEGLDGVGQQWASGGADGGAGKDALFTGPCWGYGGAGFSQLSSTAKSFLHGGSTGEGGGFGGGGAAGQYGGGGGGGYSGGGGGRGGGGGGCFVMEGSKDERRSLGNDGHGSVMIVRVDND